MMSRVSTFLSDFYNDISIDGKLSVISRFKFCTENHRYRNNIFPWFIFCSSYSPNDHIIKNSIPSSFRLKKKIFDYIEPLNDALLVAEVYDYLKCLFTARSFLVLSLKRFPSEVERRKKKPHSIQLS